MGDDLNHYIPIARKKQRKEDDPFGGRGHSGGGGDGRGDFRGARGDFRGTKGDFRGAKGDDRQVTQPKPPMPQPPAAAALAKRIATNAVPTLPENVPNAPDEPSAPVTNIWCDGMKWEEMNLNQRIRYLTPRLQVNQGKSKVDESFYWAVLHTATKKHTGDLKDTNIGNVRAAGGDQTELHEKINVAVDEQNKRITKTEAAVKAAKDAVSALFRQLESSMPKSDTDDSEKDWTSEEEAVLTLRDVTEYGAHRFMERLPDHLLFTTSFDVDGTDTSQSKLCLCPCSKKKSGQWLSMFHLPDTGSSTACHKPFEHFALLAHLKTVGDQTRDPLHAGIHAYLIKLYSNHYPAGFDHEALYLNNQHNLFKQVMAYKQRLRENILADLRNKISKEREDFDRASKMSAEERKTLKQRRAIFDNLGLTGGEATSKDLSTTEINRIDEKYKQFLNAIRGVSKDYVGINSPDIPQPMDLSLLFQEWCSMAECDDDESFLFRDLTRKDQRLLLRKARWNFADQATASSSFDKGVDQGGLTRVFLEYVWSKMHTLSINVNSNLGKTVRLFDSEDAVVPRRDAHIRQDIAECFGLDVEKGDDHNHKEATRVRNQVKCYYRAIGRLMIHSLATGHVLPYYIMPPFFRAYFFCDCRPNDSFSYASVEQKQALFSHIQQLGFANFDAFKYNEEGECDPDNFLRKMDKQLLEDRSIALSSIFDGLVLATGRAMTAAERVDEESPVEAAINLSLFFFDRNVQAVNEILFAADGLSADLIIKNLVGKALPKDTIFFHPVLNNIQERFMKETLPNLLRRKEKEEQDTGETKSLYARRFLKHITGLGFFNRNMPDISIVFVVSMQENSRPHAHTCERSLDIPFGAYENNEDTLDKYLNDAYLQSAEQGVTSS